MNFISVIPIVVSASSLVVSFINFLSIRKERITKQATQIVAAIDSNNKKSPDRNDKHSVPLPVVLKNFSNTAFSDVFVIPVEDYHYSFKGINDFSYAISLKHYKYIRKLIETEKSFWVATSGSGMSKSPDVVILFTDGNGRQWLKTPSNKLFRMKGYKEKLFKLGLPNPGYDKI
ncbi:hypothetical protein MKX69_01500 [Enterococcus sp. FSL R5-0957]|uniref:hypothetical protein n=1 Tax=Enterococcus TaxID=1350 RepID=UPI00145C36E8|nr:hypothetical protein [Enterococcus lactis]MCA6746265.1 hypothetical protein [Enterococcus lactis]NMP84366.1 hypothetical protein [Enterococcus faecium]